MLSRSLSDAMADNPGAKAACNIAIHDLAARHLGVPLLELLGGQESVRAHSQLGNATVDSLPRRGGS